MFTTTDRPFFSLPPIEFNNMLSTCGPLSGYNSTKTNQNFEIIDTHIKYIHKTTKLDRIIVSKIKRKVLIISDRQIIKDVVNNMISYYLKLKIILDEYNKLYILKRNV